MKYPTVLKSNHSSADDTRTSATRVIFFRIFFPLTETKNCYVRFYTTAVNSNAGKTSTGIYSREQIANKCFPITPRMGRHEVDKEVLLWGNILTAVAYLVIAVQLVIFVRNRKVSNEQ